MGTQAALDGLASLMRTLPGVGDTRVHAHRQPVAGSDVGVDVYLSGKPLRFNPGQSNTYGVEMQARLTVLGTDLAYGEQTLASIIDELAKLEDTPEGNTLNGAAVESNWDMAALGITDDESHLALTFNVVAILQTREE